VKSGRWEGEEDLVSLKMINPRKQCYRMKHSNLSHMNAKSSTIKTFSDTLIALA
jgi:hypothetical protein